MSVFLIDYENVRTSAFNGLEDLTENDRVIIFYTGNSDNLTFSLMQRLISSRAPIEYKKVACGGKNSLDFQLCSYLGYLIGTSSNTHFCIISRDKGFSTMLSLWGESCENGNSVMCAANISCGGAANEAVTEEIQAEAQEEAQPEVQAEIQPDEQPEAQPEPDAEPKPRKRRTYKRRPKAPAAEQTA